MVHKDGPHGVTNAQTTKTLNGIWQYRVRVPADVAESVGCDVIKESRHTRDEAEAISRFTIRHAQSLAEWERHRTQLTAIPRRLSQKECVALPSIDMLRPERRKRSVHANEVNCDP